jgi:8-oxo-dGTP diphosphatase
VAGPPAFVRKNRNNMPHIHDKIDFTVSVYIVCNDKVLLRYHDKARQWLAPGGHIELDEDPTETVIKEVQEEVGLKVEIVADEVKQFKGPAGVDLGLNLPLPLAINRHRMNENHEHVDFIYAAKSNSMDINPAEGEMVDPENFRWVTKDELLNMNDVFDSVKYYASLALQKVLNN